MQRQNRKCSEGKERFRQPPDQRRGADGGPHFMPCWKTEFLLVLQMIRSAHWTTTMLTKKAVWQVNSTTFLCS